MKLNEFINQIEISPWEQTCLHVKSVLSYYNKKKDFENAQRTHQSKANFIITWPLL